MTRSRVIMDIETIGGDWASFSDDERAYLIRKADWIETAARERLALSALTGEIVLVGMLNPDTGGKHMHVRWPLSHPMGMPILPIPAVTVDLAFGNLDEAIGVEKSDDRSVIVWPDESSLLEAFWVDLANYDQIISFNGRAFDGPFLMHRSMIRGVQVGCDLVPNRYHDTHLDLADRLSCYGATRDRYSLDFWCRRLGIPSPKDGGVNGADVERLWREGKLAELCRYNAGDLTATAALFAKYAAAFGNLLPK